jgi:uncharacterized protein
MLKKLIAATGHRLELELRPQVPSQLGLPDTPLGRRLRRHRRAIIELAERRGAHNIRVFGSVARGEDTAGSDVDLVVDLDDGVSLIGLEGMRRELAHLLRTDVDVVPAATLKPGTRDEILAEAIAL